MGLLAAALLLLSGGTPGTEGRWWFIAGEADMVFYADSLTLTGAEAIADITYEQVYRERRKDRVTRRVVRSKYNCAERLFAQVSVTGYDAEGRAQAGSGGLIEDPVVHPIPPDSIAETIYLFACSDPAAWERLGYRSVYRPTDRVTTDFYSLVEMGLPDETAIALARYHRDQHPDELEEVIRALVPKDMQHPLREAYGLPVPLDLTT